MEVQYGPKIEENSLKMAMFAPRWAVLGDLGVMLRHVGGKMVTKSAKMSQHRRQEANPRGCEGSAGARDGNATLDFAPCVGFWLGGVARTGFFILLLEAISFKT